MSKRKNPATEQVPAKKRAPGPTSEEGKKRSSLNATRHGCRSLQRILPGESEEDYEELWQEWLEEYTPQSKFDLRLIEAAVNCAWRLRRADKALEDVERGMLAFDCAQGPDESKDALQWNDEYVKRLQLMQRYRTTAENSFNKASRAVELQCERKKAQKREFEREVEDVVEQLKEPELTKAKALIAETLIAKADRAKSKAAEAPERPGACSCAMCRAKQRILDRETRVIEDEPRKEEPVEPAV
ncbi:MAG: hypothetical protein JO061_10865 [Acidobacteriaceae bacterium]|nr:hypothetical protein [Acidobacteriaceae bacterium]